MLSEPDQKTVPITEFKAKCLALIDEMNHTRECIVITRHGHPVARVAPPTPEVGGLCGLYAGVLVDMEPESLGYTEAEWDEAMADWEANQNWWLPGPGGADTPAEASGPGTS